MRKTLVTLMVVAALLVRGDARALEARSSGGSSFNPAAPGNMGTGTSGTGQFTKLAVGASVPTLPASVGAALVGQLELNSVTCGSADNIPGLCFDGSVVQFRLNGATPAFSSNVAVGITTFNFGVVAPSYTSTTAAGISGGGALSTGSNSFAGTITAAAATGNVLTPGFTCPNAVVATWQDNTTNGGAKTTARTTTTITFSATAADTVDYVASCR